MGSGPLKTNYDELTAQRATMSAMMLLVDKRKKNDHGCVDQPPTAQKETWQNREEGVQGRRDETANWPLHSTVHHHNQVQALDLGSCSSVIALKGYYGYVIPQGN